MVDQGGHSPAAKHSPRQLDGEGNSLWGEAPGLMSRQLVGVQKFGPHWRAA